VPAAAVIQRVQALIGFTGRKGRVGGCVTWDVHLILRNWSAIEGSGISGVAVKCVDIGRNTSGEGGYLD
jgi:hypothetical protein